MENKGVIAISELAENLKSNKERQITREEFKAVLRQYLSGPHVDQQITQLWDKLCRDYRSTIGQEEVCTFLLHEMQQRESQARAHFITPLPPHPSFSRMTNTKETVCGLLTMSDPPQYLTVSKDGFLSVWSTRFQLQQATSLYGRGRQRVGRSQRNSVWVTSCVMVCGRLAVATTSRELCFYDTVSFSCLHRLHKLPCVPLCMVFGQEEESCTGHLVWGDENGCVGILSFSEPSKALFNSTLITFGRLGEHVSRVKLQYEQVHSDWVCQVGWTGPGHCIISSARSSTSSLLIQHVCAQRKKYIFQVRMGVSCFAYSQKLEVLATGSLDHIVRLWTPFSPQCPVACLSSHLAGIVGVAIAEQPQYLLSLAQDLSLCVWDVREHHLLQTVSVKFPFTQRLPDFGSSPLSLLTLPSPTLTVTCNEYIARFNLVSSGVQSEGTRLGASHSHPVCEVIYCPLLDQLVSGCEGGEVKVWEVTSGRCVMKVEGCHGDQELTALTVDSGGSRILTGSHDGTIKVWESLTGQCLQSLSTAGHTEVSHILYHAERKRFLATGWNKTISVFEDKPHGLSPAQVWNKETPHDDDIIAMDYCSPHYLATGSFDGLTVVWNTDTERIMSQFHSMTKIRHSVLSEKRSHIQPTHSATPSTPSRPASRRLSAYHLKSASSSHLYHVPVDQLLFLKARMQSKIRGQATLVTSGGGHAHFWDIFNTASALGRFPLTLHEDEVVFALATDDACQWLLAGDTAGHLSLFNIAQYCTTPPQEDNDVMLEPVCTWQGNASEILSVAWAGPGFMASASGDHSVQMWTIQSNCVGYFGQPQLWNSADPATFQHETPALPHSSPGYPSTPPIAETQLHSHTCLCPGKGEKDIGECPDEVQERRVEMEPLDVGLESPTEELTALKNKSLGTAYQAGISRRMVERQERRIHFSEVDTSSISRFPSLLSPFQALHVPDIGDVTVPQDVAAALNS